jgi:hypothetical protein
MVLIQHTTAPNTFYITTLDNGTILRLRDLDELEISLSNFGHWVSEPSAILALRSYANRNNHILLEVRPT